MIRRLVLGSLLLTACGITDAPPPDPNKFITVTVVTGADQIDLPGAVLDDSIVVRLKSTISNNIEEVRNKKVTFKASVESGITFSPSTAITDANGIARTQAKLGSAVGRHTIQVNFDGSTAVPWTFMLEAAASPTIASVTPTSTAAAGQIVITGTGFNSNPLLNEVIIDNSRATITSATTTRIEAQVPACVPTRAAQLIVRRGALESPPVQLSVTGSSAQPISLNVGQMTAVSDVNSIGCLRLAGQAAGAEYIVITQNTITSGTTQAPIRLLGMRYGTPAASLVEEFAVAPMHNDAQTKFSAMLHERAAEALKRPQVERPAAARMNSAVAVPVVGEKRDFRVFVPNQPAPTISAVVRGVSQYMAVYEDVEAAGSVPQSDIDALLSVLDDPILSTDQAVFGTASDLDRNQRIVVLLTPAVNRLTKAGETSFIPGYFDPCDLLEPGECPDSNRSEILYSFVPDPTGKWGLTHPLSRVNALLPPLAAHELAHLLHFNQRTFVTGNRTPEDLWLSEAIAHFAEDTVSGVLRVRGRIAEADSYNRENYVRGVFFLRAPDKTSLVASTGEASLEERGASWLFLKYLNTRIGGTFLSRVEKSTQTGAANVIAAAGMPWNQMVRDWAIALMSSSLSVPATQTFGGFDLRAALATVSSSGFPLKPVESGAADFSLDFAMRPSSTSFVRLVAPAGGAVNLTVAGDRGGAFSTAAQPQVIVFRVK